MELAAAADSPAVKRLNYIGFGLILLAFVVPFAAAKLGDGNYFHAGAAVGRVFGSLLFLVVVTWAVTRNRSEMAKARGRLVTGALLLLVVGMNYANDRKDEQAAKAFAQEVLDRNAKQMVLFTDLAKRFDTIDLTQVLTPQNLTTQAGQSTARATLAQYRALLAERKALLQTYLAEYAVFFQTRAPAGTKQSAIDSMNANKDSTVRVYDTLHKVQTGLADSMTAVLDWGAAQGNRLGMRSGQLLFSGSAQQTELQALLARFEEAAKRHDAVLQETMAEQDKAQAKHQQGLKDLEQLIKK